MGYITPGEMRDAEARAYSRGLDEAKLMENAGVAVAKTIDEKYARAERGKVLVVCGLGNNGGDGLVAARLLCGHWQVRVLLLGRAGEIRTKTAARNWELLGPEVERAEAPDGKLPCRSWPVVRLGRRGP